MKLQGIADKLIQQDQRTGYAIILLDDGTKLIDYFPGVVIGEQLQLSGTWNNSSHGLYFKVKHYSSAVPSKRPDRIRFLSNLADIDPSIAESIVKAHKANTFRIIDNRLEQLREVSGINQMVLDKIKTSWQRWNITKRIRNFIKNQHNQLDPVQEIVNSHTTQILNKIPDNPYLLLPKTTSLTFDEVDRIAKKRNINNPQARNKAAIHYALTLSAQKGHMFQYRQQLIDQARKISKAFIRPQILEDMASRDQITLVNNRVYQPWLYRAEKSIEIITDRHFKALTGLKIDSIDSYYSKQQRQAIKTALKYNGLIITGAAGSGKSHIIKEIVRLYKDNNKTVMVTATTGKAAQRIQKLSEIKARTIHRFLGINHFSEPKYNRTNPIKHDLLIIDEASLIDAELMESILKAITPLTTLILIGDPNQLPSIKPGNVLADIQRSEFKVIKLTEIHRQEAGSGIITKARDVLKGKIPKLINQNNNRVLFYNSDSATIAQTVEELINTLSQQLNYDPLQDIQVITPFNDQIGGAAQLNGFLQKKLLAPSHEYLTYRNKTFNIGDKVIQLSNNYDKKVFNGEIGLIKDINLQQKSLVINFADRSINYVYQEKDQIDLAYACTVHKIQGSGYPIVIMALPERKNPILTRNLIYTAMTRAKELFIFVGSKDILEYAIQRGSNRRTSLFLDSN